MDQQRDLNRYTLARVQWMLENYNALLSRKPKRKEDEDVKPGATSRHSQWWTAQAYWKKVDRKADLDKAIAWASQSDPRRRTIIDLRYRFRHRKMKWDDIGDNLGLERTQVWRIHNHALHDIVWYLGEVSDR